MIPDPTVVLELLTAFRTSKAMFTAVSLGVFDALTDGPKSAAALSEMLVQTRNRSSGSSMSASALNCSSGKLSTRDN